MITLEPDPNVQQVYLWCDGTSGEALSLLAHLVSSLWLDIVCRTHAAWKVVSAAGFDPARAG